MRARLTRRRYMLEIERRQRCLTTFSLPIFLFTLVDIVGGFVFKQ